jgi:uridine kinase
MTQMTLDQLRDWRERGTAIGDLDLNGFDFAIRESLQVARHGQKVNRTKLLILESQFGRVHPKLDGLVDYQLWIDTPLDICLARKLIQLGTAEQSTREDSNCWEQMQSWCEMYLQSTAGLLRKQIELVSAASDASVVNDSSLVKLIERSLGVIQQQALVRLGLDDDWLDP